MPVVPILSSVLSNWMWVYSVLSDLNDHPITRASIVTAPSPRSASAVTLWRTVHVLVHYMYR